MTSALSVDRHEGPSLGAGHFALDEFGRHSCVDPAALDPSTHLLQINHPLSVPNTPTTEIVASLSPPLVRPVSGPWLPPSMGIAGQPSLLDDGLFAFHFQDFLPMCPGSVPGPDRGLLTPEMVVPVDEGSERLSDMLSMMPDGALPQSSPGASNPSLGGVGGPSAPSVLASENAVFLQAILDAANTIDMDAANTVTIDMDAVNTVDTNACISGTSVGDADTANTMTIDTDVVNTINTNACISRTSVGDAKGDQLEWEDVHDSTIIRGKFVLHPVDIIGQLELTW